MCDTPPMGEGRLAGDKLPYWVAHTMHLLTDSGEEGLDEPTRSEVRAVPASTTGRAAFDEALAVGDDRFSRIVRRLGLDADTAEVLAVLVAVELDRGLQSLVAKRNGDPAERLVTIGLLRSLFPAPHPGPLVVGAAGPLVRSCLVEVDAGAPFSARRVAVAGAVLWSVLGDETPEVGLHFGARYATTDDGAGAPLTVVVGRDPTRRLEAAMARTAGTAFLQTPMPSTPEMWRATIREASLSGGGVVLEVDGVLPAEARSQLERASHLAWCISSPVAIALEQMPRSSWEEHFTPDEPVDDDEWRDAFGNVEHTHELHAEQVRLAQPVYEAAGDIDAAVRRLSAGPMDELAVRVSPRRTWDDLVLAPPVAERLHHLVERYRHRHLVHHEWGLERFAVPGTVALFAGESGTGKSLAAEVVAGALGVDLLRIDLSGVVSKYIGETERNLERIFSAAGSSNTVLLFDEADALLGKRSGVSDARDRYANMEVSYLLQRLEVYPGVVILTTNLRKNLDQAFIRRIHVSVDFEAPAESERRAIWELILTAGAPVEGVDVDGLAEHELTGGSIRNIVETAAYFAAERTSVIGAQDVERALLLEYQKLGRLWRPGVVGS